MDGYFRSGKASGIVNSCEVSMPEIQAIQREEVAHHEARAGQQRERERELADDERAGPAADAHAGRPRAAAFLQNLVDVGLRDVQRRREPEDDAGAETDAERKANTGHPS